MVIVHSLVPGYATTSWYSLGGGTLSTPAVAREEAGLGGLVRLHFVVRGLDNKLYYKYMWWGSGGQSSWVSLGGATYDQPAVAVTAGLGPPQTSRLHVVVRGINNALYHRCVDLFLGMTCSGWTNLGGSTPSAPALAVVWTGVGENLFLFVRGADNGIYYKRWVTNAWGSSWAKVPGATNDAPAVAVLAGDLHLAVRGTDNFVYHRRGTPIDIAPGVTWDGWNKIGFRTSYPPTLEPMPDGSQLDLAFTWQALQGLYWTTWYPSTGWDGLASYGPPGDPAFIDRPAVLWTTYFSPSGGGFILHFLVRATNNVLYEKEVTCPSGGIGCSHSGWVNTNGATLSAPTAEGGIYVVRGTNNGIYYTYA